MTCPITGSEPSPGAQRRPSRPIVAKRLVAQHRRNGVAEATIERATRLLNDPHRDVLMIGFARRFATYKRATLVFSEPERLARLLGDEERPVMLMIAGKAHPHDEPGKQLIRQVYALAMSKAISRASARSSKTTTSRSHAVSSQASTSGSTRPSIRSKRAARPE